MFFLLKKKNHQNQKYDSYLHRYFLVTCCFGKLRLMSKQKRKAEDEKVPMRYWLVELTLTSGRVRTVYVKARYQADAYQKADYYASLASNEKLFDLATKNFKLLP